jgi:serine protease AprX
VVAANGNCALNDACTFGTGAPRAKSVRSPAIAHKVIGVGAVDVATQAAQTYQGLGSAPDGRYKPDLQGPTNSETASNASDTALQSFGGTSGSTPYAAGAAALMRNWLLQHKTSENGHVYAHMMNSGTLAWPTYDNTRGLGQLRMPVDGVVWWGKVNVSQGTVINIPINISSGRRDLRVSLWWPESQTEKHDDIDLYLLDPAGVQRALSISGPSIFERAWVTGSLTPGTWIVRIRGYKVQSGPQPVYWVVDAAN